MSLLDIPAGKDLPNDFNVIIEIPANGQPTKYELDKDTGVLTVDRFMPTSMIYPANYGYIPSTLCDDGDPADVLVLTPATVQAGSLIRCRALGMLPMTDESGEDNKILAVPIDKVCVEYSHLRELTDISDIMLKRIQHFFNRYKELEPNKWVKVGEWQPRSAAEEEILKSETTYAEKKSV
jgi:inorganic pyrophosphatase